MGGLMTIYTIGYQHLGPPAGRLQDIVDALDAILIDCRVKPVSRISGYYKNRLTAQFGERYDWRGNHLGGRGCTTAFGITALRATAAKRNVILMCMEEAPGDCHRHHAICAPHFPDAVHLFRDEMFTAAALEASLSAGEDAEYELIGSVRDLLVKR
jgi:uncharacterized protein (DUF488 family)